MIEGKAEVTVCKVGVLAQVYIDGPHVFGLTVTDSIVVSPGQTIGRALKPLATDRTPFILIRIESVKVQSNLLVISTTYVPEPVAKIIGLRIFVAFLLVAGLYKLPMTIGSVHLNI